MSSQSRHSLRDRARSDLYWLWMLWPLLLVCLLVIPLMDKESFYLDEGGSLFDAGGLRSVPVSISGILENVEENSPDQAFGWPVLLSFWGRLVGWSEAAIRTLPLLAGLLSIALLYRTGSDLFSPKAGFLAAFLLAGSSLLLVYISVARAYSLVLLLATLSLWCYWRVALRPSRPGAGSQAGLFLGAVGLLYSHYFGALILPALAIYHLLFLRLSRRWWRPVLLWAAALLPGLLQLPVLLQGLDFNLGNESLRGDALDAGELLSQTLFNLANGLIDPGPVVSIATLLVIPVAALIAAFRRRRALGRQKALWLPVFTAFALLWGMLLINAQFSVMAPNMIRFLMPFWPLAALSCAVLLRRPARHLATPLLFLLLTLWTLTGTHFSRSQDYRVNNHYLFPSEIHHAYRALDNHMQPGDLLVIDREATEMDPARYFDRWLAWPHRILDRGINDPLVDILPLHERHPWVWLLYRTRDRVGVRLTTAGLDRRLCEVAFEQHGYSLERLALPGLSCPGLPDRFDFGEEVTLAEPEISLQDDKLQVNLLLRSNDARKPVHYSISLQLFGIATQEWVAQRDVGIGPGNVIPLHAGIDTTALPPGEYALRLALYNWETGERLVARDLLLGHVSDIHTLQHVVLD